MLVGSYEDGGGRERPATLVLEGKEARLLPRLSGSIEVEGRLDADGIARDRSVRGRVFFRARSLAERYELELLDDAGRPLSLALERRPKLADLLFSSSSVQGELRDAEGRSVARLALRIDYRRELRRYLPL